MKLTRKDKFTAGIGTLYTINLEINGLGNKKSEFTPALMGKEVEIDGQRWTVKGIDSWFIPEEYIYSEIGLLVKEII